ncbi:transporter substrate-binding protein (plasmid) [Tundrisphaera sp. TA3]|uniref:transporter substrate-binding protein n=1 Tax=Tundrisphaera sp. TA3 TaxID=3435775 RepID=UPI003EB9251F
MWRKTAIGALIGIGALVALVVLGELAGSRTFARIGSLAAEVRPPILVGVIHSLSGPLEPYERPLRDAELLAVKQINDRGGIGGRLLEVVEADGRSDPRTFASQARRLIESNKVSVVFGGWTAESRRLMRPVIEELNSLLVFPGDFEGIEEASRIMYAGTTANQQVVPAVRWAIDRLSVKKPFLLSNDEVWSRTVAEIARDQLRCSGIEPAGELSISPGVDGVAAAVAAIRRAQPDLILNFTSGDTNTALFTSLRRAGITAAGSPALSFRMTEDDGRRINADDLSGHYLAADYLTTLDTLSNREFLRIFKAHHGDDRMPSAPAVMAHEGVRMWAKAAEEAGDPSSANVLPRLPRISLDAPEGVISVDSAIRAVWRPCHVGRFRPDGQIEATWSIDRPIRPVLYTITRGDGDWRSFLDGLREGWRGNWSGAGQTPAVPPG